MIRWLAILTKRCQTVSQINQKTLNLGKGFNPEIESEKFNFKDFYQFLHSQNVKHDNKKLKIA